MRQRHFLLFTFLISLISVTHTLATDTVAPVNIRSVSSGREYALGKATTNEPVYVDRRYSIQSIPHQLEGLPLIRTANDDDRVDRDEHLTVQLRQPAAIFVCWDERAYRPANWLRGWQRVKGKVDTDDTQFDIYSKMFEPGLVTLGGNSRESTGAQSNYFVIVGHGSGDALLESAGIVDDAMLSVRRDEPSDSDNGNGSRSGRISPPTRAPRVPPGFAVKLFAYEPMVHNPCATCFDAKGRLVVGFGPQYRNPRPNTPGDQVAVLIDENDDGVADRRQTFAEWIQ